jgi:hypothetical protein
MMDYKAMWEGLKKELTTTLAVSTGMNAALPHEQGFIKTVRYMDELEEYAKRAALDEPTPDDDTGARLEAAYEADMVRRERDAARAEVERLRLENAQLITRAADNDTLREAAHDVVKLSLHSDEPGFCAVSRDLIDELERILEGEHDD